MATTAVVFFMIEFLAFFINFIYMESYNLCFLCLASFAQQIGFVDCAEVKAVKFSLMEHTFHVNLHFFLPGSTSQRGSPMFCSKCFDVNGRIFA